jgi:hypothetical protein
VTLHTILVVKRLNALTLKGETCYSVVNGFKAPNPKPVAEKWLRDNIKTLPQGSAYFLWTPEEFEKHTGRKWVMLGF